MFSRTTDTVCFILSFCGYYFRINTRYYYQNVADGRTQWQYPTDDPHCLPQSPEIAKTNTPPPQNISEHNTNHPEPVDMDIEEDSHKEDTEIIIVRNMIMDHDYIIINGI